MCRFLRFKIHGKTLEVPLDDMDIKDPMKDLEIKTAIAAHLDGSTLLYRTYVMGRHDGLGQCLRPDELFGG